MHKLKQINIIALFLLLSSLILNSCGFQLRGQILLPERYQTIYIDNRTNSNINSLLRQALAENNINLVNSAELATSTIRLYSREVERRAIAVRGKEIKEYEISLRVTLSVHEKDGTQRGDIQTISSIRRYSFNNDQVLGATNEEQILLNEMSEDIVNQVLRRLSKIH